MKIFLLVILTALPTLSFADVEWKTARIHEVNIQEMAPVGYQLTYERRCNDVSVKPIKFVEGSDVIIGVAVKNDSSNECWKEGAIVTLKKLTIRGDFDDPQTVQILK